MNKLSGKKIGRDTPYFVIEVEAQRIVEGLLVAGENHIPMRFIMKQ